MWAMSVFNDSTLTYVIDPRDVTAYMDRDSAKRELQAWLLDEANQTEDETDAALLDDAAQRLNYAEYAHVGGSFDWTVETTSGDAIEI